MRFATFTILLAIVGVAVLVAPRMSSIGLILSGQGGCLGLDGSVTVNGQTMAAAEYRRLLEDIEAGKGHIPPTPEAVEIVKSLQHP